MRAVLIYNPAAGRRKQKRLLPRLIETLEASGFEIEAVATAGPDDATRIAREVAEAGDYEAVLVLGGDGTVREAAVGLLGTEVALGILPGGTANVLVQALGFSTDPLEAATRLAEASVRSFDVGLCGDTPFLMMASSGLDAVVMRDVHPGLKATLGSLGVLLSGLRSWWTYGYPDLILEGRTSGRHLRRSLQHPPLRRSLPPGSGSPFRRRASGPHPVPRRPEPNPAVRFRRAPGSTSGPSRRGGAPGGGSSHPRSPGPVPPN